MTDPCTGPSPTMHQVGMIADQRQQSAPQVYLSRVTARLTRRGRFHAMPFVPVRNCFHVDEERGVTVGCVHVRRGTGSGNRFS